MRGGDTLAGIAARYGVTTQTLATANNITNPNTLFAGQVLFIPAAAPVIVTPPTQPQFGTGGPVIVAPNNPLVVAPVTPATPAPAAPVVTQPVAPIMRPTYTVRTGTHCLKSPGSTAPPPKLSRS